MSRRIHKQKKYKRGTPIQDRVEPRMKALGYDTSTMQVVRFGGGQVYEIVLGGRIIGKYTSQIDELVIVETPEE